MTGGWVWAEWTVEYEGTLAGFAVALDAEPGTDPGAVPTQVEPYWDATLADGEYWLHVRGVLDDGTAGAIAHVRILADATPPEIGQLTGPSLSAGNVTDSSTVPVAWTVEPDLSGVAGYDLQLLLDGELPIRGDDPTLALDGTATSVDLQVPHEGVWSVHLRPVDTAGNVGEFARLGFAFDGEPPGPVTVTGSHADGQPTGQRRLVMSFESAWEDHVEAWAAHVDGSPDSVPDPASASPEGRITGLLDVGESWLHVSARDVLGRWGPVTHVRLVVRGGVVLGCLGDHRRVRCG